MTASRQCTFEAPKAGIAPRCVGDTEGAWCLPTGTNTAKTNNDPESGLLCDPPFKLVLSFLFFFNRARNGKCKSDYYYFLYNPFSSERISTVMFV